ncbi:MAG: hypothetical protein QM820_49170 [Minicystis sp.]
MTPFGLLVREISPYGLLALGDQLVTYQSHHHSLFLDQTVSDALGGEGWAVRRQAAFEASHALLASFFAELGVVEADERIELATELFAAMGQGRLVFDVTAEGGTVRAHGLHHGESFREKYGTRLKNRRPVDTFAAGFVSAAASLAFPSDWGTLEADEVACVARRDDLCVFALTRRPERPRFGVVVTRQLVEGLPQVSPAEVPRPSPASSRAASELARLLHGSPLSSGEEGAAFRAFGSRVAMVPVSYQSQIIFDTAHLVEKRSPELFPLVATLAREAASMGAFHLLGGVLASPAWQAEHGAPAREIEVRLDQLLGLARALGWGAFEIEEHTPGRALLLRSPMTHESAYYAARHGSAVRARLFFQQGLALALMYLLTSVDFASEQPLGPDTYDALFRGGPRFEAHETRSPLRGDTFCEVSVELAEG